MLQRGERKKFSSNGQVRGSQIVVNFGPYCCNITTTLHETVISYLKSQLYKNLVYSIEYHSKEYLELLSEIVFSCGEYLTKCKEKSCMNL
jgi:hypothetical protein